MSSGLFRFVSYVKLGRISSYHQPASVCSGTVAASSGHPQTLERGASRSSTVIRHNDQFKNGDIRESNLIFLDLAYGLRGD
jgi:hypothetical protein